MLRLVGQAAEAGFRPPPEAGPTADSCTIKALRFSLPIPLSRVTQPLLARAGGLVPLPEPRTEAKRLAVQFTQPLARSGLSVVPFRRIRVQGEKPGAHLAVRFIRMAGISTLSKPCWNPIK